MKKTLIKEISENDLQAVVDAYTLDDFYYPSIFPVMFTPTLTWRALSGDYGINVAADVVSYNVAAPKKTRNVIERLTGKIPKIEIVRVKEETDLNEYQHLQYYYSSEEGQRALMNWVYADTDFCFKGVNARLEWLALRALSTGGFVLDSSNNAGTVTETTVDFGVPEEHKLKATTAWNEENAASATPISDIRSVVAKGVGEGMLLKYMFMDLETFYAMMASDEAIDFCSSWVPQVGRLKIPNVDEVNIALKAHRLPEIRLIDTYVTLEGQSGQRTTVNPWERGVVTFVPELACGYTYHGPMADEMVTDSVATKVKREHILIKKYSTEDPVTEVTKGIANAIPVWGNADRCFLFDTLAGQGE